MRELTEPLIVTASVLVFLVLLVLGFRSTPTPTPEPEPTCVVEPGQVWIDVTPANPFEDADTLAIHIIAVKDGYAKFHIDSTYVGVYHTSTVCGQFTLAD